MCWIFSVLCSLQIAILAFTGTDPFLSFASTASNDAYKMTEYIQNVPEILFAV